MTERHGLLPEQHMDARTGTRRSTETAVSLLLSQIRTVWAEPDSVASVLSLDISGTFDRVVKERLVHTLLSLRISVSTLTQKYNITFAPDETGEIFEKRALDTFTTMFPPLKMISNLVE